MRTGYPIVADWPKETRVLISHQIWALRRVIPNQLDTAWTSRGSDGTCLPRVDSPLRQQFLGCANRVLRQHSNHPNAHVQGRFDVLLTDRTGCLG